MIEHVITVNGQRHEVAAAPTQRLSSVLRRNLGLVGTKVGCDAGDCGACTVLIDGLPHCACLTPVSATTDKVIETVEVLASDPVSRNLQHAFLRHGAAQCGICTPGMLMTATALLRRNPYPSRAEAENWLGGVLCRCTGYAKIIDAVCAASADMAPPVQAPVGNAVGCRVDRLDGVRKIDGSEVFGDDVAPPDACDVLVIRSPYWKAGFQFGDILQWIDGQPDIVTVCTAKDITGTNRFGVIPNCQDQPVLAENVARFRGEAVALIVVTPGAGDAIDTGSFPITWAELPVAAVPVHEDHPDNLLITGLVRCGDAKRAAQDAPTTVSGTMKTGFVEHAYIEPEAGCAWMDGTVLTIAASTQAPVMDLGSTADALGLAKDAVRIQPTAAGGGFGSKLDVSLQPLLGLAVLKSGRPCRMVYTRRASMQSTTKRHPSDMRASLSARADGTLVSMQFEGDFDTGAYASWGPTVANRVPVHASGPYNVPHYSAQAHAWYSYGPIAGAFRGFGVPQATLLQETLLDQLANKLNIDRLAIRLKNALRDGQKTPCGQKLYGVGITACLEALSDDWERGREWANTPGRGIGIASCWYGCGNTGLANPSTIRIGLKSSGRICLHQGAVDIGQGANTVIAQIAADALQISLDEIDLIGPDTALTPDCGKTSASRQTYVTGKAAEAAGRALRAGILQRLNAGEAAQLTIKGGKIHANEAGTTKQLDLSTMPVDDFGYVVCAQETYNPPTTALDENGQGSPYAVYGYGAQIAMVEVDRELGQTKVVEIVAAHDVGRVINPTLAEGQIEGGIAQGLGLALMEEYIPGRTEDLHNYLIPTTGDMPRITSKLIEVPDPEGPFGAKGLGEHVLIPTAPAILNAIGHATGVTLTRVPVLPHRLKAALDAQSGTP